MEKSPSGPEKFWIEVLPEDERRIAEHVRSIRFNPKLSSEAREVLSELVVEYATRLRAKYKEHLREYRLYHALIGSTPNPADALFDLPGEDSVVTFAEDVLLPATQTKNP
jgi:hypothetical protein